MAKSAPTWAGAQRAYTLNVTHSQMVCSFTFTLSTADLFPLQIRLLSSCLQVHLASTGEMGDGTLIWLITCGG